MRSQLSGQKIATGVNVLEAAQSRINWIFDTFSKVCLSFSGGKDSTVLFHLLADEARRRRRKFGVLFIDWEVQFQATIQHVSNMKETYRDCVEQFYWIAVPLTTESGVSQLQPTWTAWEPGKTWVRQPPETAITDTSSFPFYKAGMTFEAFIPAFNSWVMQGKPGIVLTGIRADESLNRFLSINSQKNSVMLMISRGQQPHPRVFTIQAVRFMTGTLRIYGHTRLKTDYFLILYTI